MCIGVVMSKENTKSNKLIIVAFALYVLLLTWIIVFKFRLNLSDLKYIRTINLIPFKANGVVNGMRETIINLVLFIPLGMYLKYLLNDRKILSIIIISSTSLLFEILQYIFHIGVSDITDIIMNTIGGIIGMILMMIFLSITKKNNILNKTLDYLLIFLPLVMFLGLFII